MRASTVDQWQVRTGPPLRLKSNPAATVRQGKGLFCACWKYETFAASESEFTQEGRRIQYHVTGKGGRETPCAASSEAR